MAVAVHPLQSLSTGRHVHEGLPSVDSVSKRTENCALLQIFGAVLVKLLVRLSLFVGLMAVLFLPLGELLAKEKDEAVVPSIARIEGLLDAMRWDVEALQWPVVGQSRVSSLFGPRAHPIGGKKRLHKGIDIAAPQGTPIVAIAPGRVIFVGKRRGFGRLVEIAHAGGWHSKYAHASTTTVTLGQRVDGGQMIATVGATGHATGPHLHLEIRQSGKSVDPLPLLRQRWVAIEP